MCKLHSQVWMHAQGSWPACLVPLFSTNACVPSPRQGSPTEAGVCATARCPDLASQASVRAAHKQAQARTQG